ncbi:tRNA preQ1(34) S-adenosylmethionine ribosyltransferase-isomerase QueA [Patescibacteria group bacterium]|nr:tRNA preQ1(34) S-adenosylmethionine ribosyltransferase-isomerase QueA [Patescibacteria group bacterium]
MDPSAFAYHLPPDLIAVSPTSPRDHCRLLCVNRYTGELTHHHFYELSEFLTPNDVLVFNQTRVFPARLFGRKNTGGRVEILLLENHTPRQWLTLSRPGLKANTELNFDHGLQGRVVSVDRDTGEVAVEFNQDQSTLYQTLDRIGHTPIPPYIHTQAPETKLRRDYQTVYARVSGSAAAPTAGLHFTPELINRLTAQGVDIKYLTLHVGLGTFKPLETKNLESGTLHREWYDISPDTAADILQAKKQGKRIIAVGTTTVRTLESFARSNKLTGTTDLFIYPPYRFHLVDSLITNFHLPESSLLMLVTAFTHAPNTTTAFTTFPESFLGRAYETAIQEHYRFFSFGDAMWIY